MASGIFALFDDIAALMDDVAVASKIATKKTAGILGDDLAVNAEKATGFLSSRELPVLWKITKGSFLNKLIIIPIIFLLEKNFPIFIEILLLLGGLYLAYEGVEKIIHWITHRKKTGKEVIEENTDNHIDAEKTKVRSAVLTDFILSLEIVIIALSSVLEKPFNIQIITVSIVAILATIGVYGLVAILVRMDDAGFKLIKLSKEKGIVNSIGNILVNALPVIIKILGVLGTIALLLVSGGIFAHFEYIPAFVQEIPEYLRELALGISMGLMVFILITLGKKIIDLFKK